MYGQKYAQALPVLKEKLPTSFASSDMHHWKDFKMVMDNQKEGECLEKRS